MAAFPHRLTKPFHHQFAVEEGGLVAISVTARCKSAQQLPSDTDEDMRVEINGLQCRETFPQKYEQLFNVPPAFNGTKLQGLQKTVVFMTVLNRGHHVASLIPRPSAHIEEIRIEELHSRNNTVTLDIDQQAEDGNRRPWYTFVAIDLPLNEIAVDATVQRRWRDSDDVKIILNDEVKKDAPVGRHIYWFIMGGLLGWLIAGKRGRQKRVQARFSENLDHGIHYLEIYADRMPVLHSVTLSFEYTESTAKQRAAHIITQHAPLITMAGREFNVEPALVGSVIFQEQATNINFLDYLADYMGGLAGINTSIGVAQIRVETAAALEKQYPSLNPLGADNVDADERLVRIERLKHPLTNIRYAAAKLALVQRRWREAGFDITPKPEILGTLYNIDNVDDPIEPHADAQPNEFGEGVARNYPKVKHLLAQ